MMHLIRIDRCRANEPDEIWMLSFVEPLNISKYVEFRAQRFALPFDCFELRRYVVGANNRIKF